MLTSLTNEDNGKLNLTLFNDAMLNLEENGRIYNGGKDGKDSCYIKEIGTNETEKQIDVLSESEEFDIIDNKFEHILNQRIKTQIILELHLLLKDVNENKSNSKEDTTDHRLIDKLNNEILFLISELLNKNKIIELLITNTGHNFGIEKQSTTLKKLTT